MAQSDHENIVRNATPRHRERPTPGRRIADQIHTVPCPDSTRSDRDDDRIVQKSDAGGETGLIPVERRGAPPVLRVTTMERRASRPSGTDARAATSSLNFGESRSRSLLIVPMNYTIFFRIERSGVRCPSAWACMVSTNPS